MSQPKNKRGRQLARIHCLAKELTLKTGQSKDEYRDMLEAVTGKRSAADLTDSQRYKVIGHIASLLNGPQRPLERNPGGSSQMMKIKALLLAGGKSTAYGDGCASRICGVDRLEWVPENQLYKIITALRKQGQRKGWDIK